MNQTAFSEVRTFRNSKGVELKAEFLGLQGASVRIRRISDGKTFTLPLASLSAADQAWIKSQKSTTPAASTTPGAPWQPLVVEHPSPPSVSEMVEYIGANRMTASFPTGATTSEMLLPIGGWVILQVRAGSTYHKHIVRFNGAAHWKLSTDGPFLLVSRDGGPAEIVGIFRDDQQRGNSFEAALKANSHPFGASVCFNWDNRVELSTLPPVGGKPVAFFLDSAPDAERLKAIATHKPLALYADITIDTVSALSALTTLEALKISASGARDSGPIPITDLPPVRDLSLSGFELTADLQLALSKLTNLRILQMAARNPAPVQWTGLSKNSNLERLDLARIIVDPAEIGSLQHLRSLTMLSDLRPQNDPGVKEFANLNQLQLLEERGLSEEDFTTWAKSGALANLEILRISKPVSGTHFPKLRAVELDFTLSIQDDQGILRSYGSPKELKYFNAGGIKEDNWRTICRFGNRDSIEAMELSFFEKSFTPDAVDESTSKDLTSFPRLRWLEARGLGFRTMDLAPLRNLEFLDLDSEIVEEVDGLANHPKLRFLDLANCDNLKKVGPSGPNQVIRR